MRNNKHRDSTKKNYYCVWKLFNKFFIQLDVKPRNWEDRLTLFVGYLVETQKKSTTVRSYVSAIKAILLEAGKEIKEDKFLISAMTKACCLRNDKIHHKFPIKRNLLHAMYDQLPNVFPDQMYLVVLYRAMFLMAYYVLLQICEITDTKSGHALKAVDVHIGRNKNKILLILHSSKTHTKGSKPQLIKIEDSSCGTEGRNGKYCPFLALREYIRLRRSVRNEDEQFFVY